MVTITGKAIIIDNAIVSAAPRRTLFSELVPYGCDGLELIMKLMLTCVSNGEALPKTRNGRYRHDRTAAIVATYSRAGPRIK